MNSPAQLPSEIRKAIREYGNAEFWCGAWQDEALDGPYSVREERAKEARAELERVLLEHI